MWTMSMILFACVVRVRDGLPLSASTDFHPNKDFAECKKRLKVLSGTLAGVPDRGTAEGCPLSIHFHTFGDVSCMSICSSSYPAAMAFCFLEELQWKFITTYDNVSIGLATRPYAFLEFDSVIQKVKWQFNYASNIQMKMGLENMEQARISQSPVVLKLEEIGERNGVVNGYAHVHTEAAPNHRMRPVTALGILSLILNIMCGALNLIRGVHLAEHSFQDDFENVGKVTAFLASFVGCIFQCYLYLFYASARRLKTFGLLVFICLCNIYLYGLRNLWQIFFHAGIALLSAHQILTRKLLEKQQDCGV
ncbi:vesicle-trafficking protein SEC22c [Ambystoma mexicanum]|uniref:vesicle-trafficking protein SEC22c n=1 Tax=Ambystoma mexicanum TaxID=8296 RepID=UPI0037E9020B